MNEADQLRNISDTLVHLNEMPRLRDEELLLGLDNNISHDQLNRAYSYIGSIRHNTIKIYEKTDSSGFIAGVDIDHLFTIFLDIKTRKKSYPVLPTGLRDYQQVSMVLIGDQFAERGYAREVYEFLATKFDLVSDHEQYLGAKRLWKSLAKSGKINIYVFDGEINDYVSDKHGVIVYNGENINDRLIWGDTIEHSMRLLVASRGIP
jgi:hypothetical protein